MELLPSRRTFCVHHTAISLVYRVTYVGWSHIRRVHVCLSVICHLHFWQNDRDLLRATAKARGLNGYWNKSQHREMTMKKQISHAAPAGTQTRTRVLLITSPALHHWAIPVRKLGLKADWDQNRLFCQTLFLKWKSASMQTNCVKFGSSAETCRLCKCSGYHGNGGRARAVRQSHTALNQTVEWAQGRKNNNNNNTQTKLKKRKKEKRRRRNWKKNRKKTWVAMHSPVVFSHQWPYDLTVPWESLSTSTGIVIIFQCHYTHCRYQLIYHFSLCLFTAR